MDIDALIAQRINALLGTPPPASVSGPRGKLNAETRKYRLDHGLCLYAGCTGHMASSCPLLLAAQARQTQPSGNAPGRV
jgi:hypothetical protein